MTKPDYRRLDIWYVRLDPTEGSEAQKRCDPQLLSEAKSLRDAGATRRSAQDARERAPRQTRPCLILQNDTGNQYSDVTIIAPQRVRADRRKTTGNALHSASNRKSIPLLSLSNHRKLMD